MKGKKTNPGLIKNRRATFDYELEDRYTVGIVLSGKETKALRLKHGHLQGAFVNIRDGELYLTNATITSTPSFEIPEDDRTRPRKLLASKKEIAQIIAAKQSGRYIVPLAFVTNGRYIKVQIATGKSKKSVDKRSRIQERQQNIEAERAMKRKVR